MNVLTFSFPLKLFILGYEQRTSEWYWLTTDAGVNGGTANATIFIDFLTTNYEKSDMLGRNYSHRNFVKISGDKKNINWYSTDSAVYQYNKDHTFFYFGIG